MGYKGRSARRTTGRLIGALALVAALAGILLLLAQTLFHEPEPAQPVSGQNGGDVLTQPGGDEPQQPQQPEEPEEPEERPWNLRLVNFENPLPQDYAIETKSLLNGLEVDARIYEKLTAMLSDGRSEGLQFVVCSAWRSVEKQT